MRWVRWAVLGALLAAAVPAGWFWYVRHWRRNFSCVVPGRVYRSGSPSVSQLQTWTDKYGLKTLINLAPARDEPARALEQAAGRLGLACLSLPLPGNEAPTREQVRALIRQIETARQPILLACPDGVARTGLAATVAAMALGDKPYEQARHELFSQFQYTGGRNEDSVGAFLLAYEDHCQEAHDAAATRPASASAPATGSWAHFRAWALEDYHPYYYHVEIAAPPSLSLSPGETAVVEVTLTNRSRHMLPLADTHRRFHIAAFLGTSESDAPETPLGPPSPLPRENLLPRESLHLSFPLTAPRAPGLYTAGLDLFEEGHTWFARQGSSISRLRLTVAPRAHPITR